MIYKVTFWFKDWTDNCDVKSVSFKSSKLLSLEDMLRTFSNNGFIAWAQVDCEVSHE